MASDRGGDGRSSKAARWLGVLRLSRRQLQQRWLESMLIVLGIALGVGVLTTGETFVRFQERMNTELVAGQVREWEAVTVRQLSSSAGSALFGADAVPAVRVSLQDLEEPVRFTLADLLAMRTDVPGVKYVTVQEGSSGMEIIAVDDVALEPDFYELFPEATGDEASSAVGDGEAVSDGEGTEVVSGPSGETVANNIVASVDDEMRPVFPMLQLDLVTADEFGALGFQFVAGAPFTWDDFVEGNRRIVLERRSAERLFPELGVADVVGRSVTTMGGGPDGEGNRWVIVGVVELPEQLGFMLRMAFDTDDSNRAFGYAPATAGWRRPASVAAGSSGASEDALSWTSGRLYLSPEDDSRIPEITASAQVYFDQKYGTGRVELRNPVAERESSLEGLASTIIALLVLAGLGLIIAAVNVLNLFTARVLRRLRITGMSVALGATQRLLFWQTAGEALLLGASGSVLGIGLAGGFVTVIRALLTAQTQGELPPGFNPFASFKVGLPDAAIGLVAGVGLSLIFGLYPAWLGSRQDPVEALRVE